MNLSQMSGKYNLKYLQMLARQYPTIGAASSEIINLQAILNLPKGTEHFMSDVHGEHEAFSHILANASGAVREKVDILYENSMTREDRAQLATLIYYPTEKLEEIKSTVSDLDEWYRLTLNRLIEICRLVSSKYTRSKVRKSLPKEYGYIIDELLNTNYEVFNKKEYYENIISTIIHIDRADDFVVAVCDVIKRLVVDHLHIVGDIFDRGPRADIIMDSLMSLRSVDIQWGNHDVLWMGAATGSRTCIATVLVNSITYNNLDVIETGYGISLRPLALFANEIYQSADTGCFQVRTGNDPNKKSKDIALSARMHKAIAIILFKLEGQIIKRNPAFGMDDRLLLDKIDFDKQQVLIGESWYPLKDCDFPTVNPADPYALSREEKDLMDRLKYSFMRSEKLQKHVRFLYSKGSLYKCYNSNLLFHGCIPMNADKSFMQFNIGCRNLSGKAFMDFAESTARKGYYAAENSQEKQFGKDFLWFLWGGRNSPLFGRDRMTTFERRLVADQTTWEEPKNAYYGCYEDAAACDRILSEFGLDGPHCHIINGHVPVRSKDGENPVKAEGRLIVIDGGFSKAYQPTTGIAGYTLIYNSWGIRISAHEPFTSKTDAIKNNTDIHSVTNIFDRMDNRIKISETDNGKRLLETIDDLKWLLLAYKTGEIKEDHNAPPIPG